MGVTVTYKESNIGLEELRILIEDPLHQITRWTPVQYTVLFRYVLAQRLGLPFVPNAFRFLKVLKRQWCYYSLPFCLDLDLCPQIYVTSYLTQ